MANQKKRDPLSKLSFTTFFLIVISLALANWLLDSPFNFSIFATRIGKFSKELTPYTFELHPGWNFIALPVHARQTARKACREISGSVYIAKWTDQDWEYYDCSERRARNNYSLDPHRGYFIQVEGPATWIVEGIETEPVYALVEGWNSWGVPMAGEIEIKAQSLCGPFTGGEFAVTEVERWLNGGWDAHICTLSNLNNYVLEKGAGYFIRAVLVGGSNTQQTPVPALKTQ